MRRKTVNNWTTLRRQGTRRIKDWVRQSEDLLMYITSIMDHIYEYENSQTFMKYVQSETENLPEHIKMEVRTVIMAMIFGADIEEEDQQPHD